MRPAGENVQQWLYDAEEGGEGYERAWHQIMDDNPFPAVMGGSATTRARASATALSSTRRWASTPSSGSSATRRSRDAGAWRSLRPSSGKRVLVVGAGPSGLSAAYHLARLGHAVTIVDAGPRAGGMMRFGIPRYRLPREVLDAEIERIVELGVAIELNRKVTSILDTMREGRFDAAFIAVGAHLGRARTSRPARRPGPRRGVAAPQHGGRGPAAARQTVVDGGGNTAIDAARTAKRLGAEEAIVVYRRTRERMPAHDFEVEEAEDEGVLMKWLSTIKHVDAGARRRAHGTRRHRLPAADRRSRSSKPTC